MANGHQGAMFPEELSRLPPNASIKAALSGYEKYLAEEATNQNTNLPLSVNTQKAFLSDVTLLADYLGGGLPVAGVGTRNLNDFLEWMLTERGVPCSRKTYARRITSLKHFFDFLEMKGVRPDNPAEALIQISVTSPLPTLPSEQDIERALVETRQILEGSGGRKKDARPHLLLTLLLQTGIKKQEAMRIVRYHIIRDNPDEPVLFIPYSRPKDRQFKERRLPLEPGWLDTLDEYMEQYQPTDNLFTCTARNLEYVLSNIADEVGLEHGSLSFENLRWIFALRLYKNGEKSMRIKQKLGLFDSSWRETKRKLEQLDARTDG